MTVPMFASLPRPTLPPSIDLRCCDVREMLESVRGAVLMMSDSPWRYAREAGGANPEMNGIYNGLDEVELVAIHDQAYDSAAKDCRLAAWYTWPKDAEWSAAGGAGPRWGARVSGGAWTKIGQVGVGYHWRGYTEPVALFTKGSVGRCRDVLLNGHVSRPGDHSEKPVAWLREWVRAWTDPGDLVVEMFAGFAPMARACLAEGRRYVGAEIDPERHSKAVDRLVMFGGRL